MSLIKVLRGIQGIGKSTLAQKIIEHDTNCVRVNKDAIRMMEAPTYSRSNGDLVDEVMHSFIEAALKRNKNIVIDNTNCFLKHIDDIINRYHLLADIEIIAFPNDTMKAITQNDKRTGSAWIEPKIISDFSAGFRKSEYTLNKRGYTTRTEGNLFIYEIPQKVIVPYVPNEKLTDTVVFDIDSTLSKICDRGIYEFHKCGGDTTINSTTKILHSITNVDGYVKDASRIIFVTGRGEECRKETLEWLKSKIDSNIHTSQLYMRPWKDFRRDSVVKEEIFNQQLRTNYNIIAWFDDSPKVIKEFLIPYNIPVFDSTHSHYDNIL